MSTLTFDVFSEVLNTGADRFDHVIRERLSKQGRAFRESAKRNALKRFRTGTTTANAARATLHRSRPMLLAGLDTAKSPGGFIQDTGGVIRATRGPWLFIPQPDGSFRVAKEVRIKATHWLSDAWAATKRSTPDALDGALRDALGGR